MFRFDVIDEDNDPRFDGDDPYFWLRKGFPRAEMNQTMIQELRFVNNVWIDAENNPENLEGFGL